MSDPTVDNAIEVVRSSLTRKPLVQKTQQTINEDNVGMGENMCVVGVGNSDADKSGICDKAGGDKVSQEKRSCIAEHVRKKVTWHQNLVQIIEPTRICAKQVYWKGLGSFPANAIGRCKAKHRNLNQHPPGFYQNGRFRTGQKLFGERQQLIRFCCAGNKK